ncbi:hypothetical protein H072_8815 [Dactylellina haptotyla CBS 200.50]|uniref:DUF7223 domain-containing protein n=1 Tax=Dactylellina haptotyla (strain CBS 200.50) TaxID=1284197 RepID=S8BE45_DACHA|nr:hypothetical protein H072_8815 [Dactylellina haptotyla CBS 200.50]
MSKEEFKEYLAKIAVTPYAEDTKSHPIMRFDTIKAFVKGQPIMDVGKSGTITLKFLEKKHVEYAEKQWKLEKNDPKDYFYFVTEERVPNKPGLVRAVLHQIQKVTMNADGLTAVMEAYLMAWDVLGELDIGIYTINPGQNQPRNQNGLSKRSDWNPKWPISVNFNKDGTTLFEKKLGSSTAIAEGSFKIVCKECHATGTIELAARFRTSWWMIREASLTMATKSLKAVVDIQAQVVLKKEPEPFRKQIASFPISPLTIFGIINFGPTITIEAYNKIAVTGKFTAGVKLDAVVPDGYVKLDFADLQSFDLSTFYGPEVTWKPYIEEASVEVKGTVAAITSLGVSLDILGSGVGSSMELWLPKFRYKIKAVFIKEGFCPKDGKKAEEEKDEKETKKTDGTKDGKKDGKKDGGNGETSGERRLRTSNGPNPSRTQQRLALRDSAALAKNKTEKPIEDLGISAEAKLGLQVKFVGIHGKGVLRSILKKVSHKTTWEPDALNFMPTIGKPLCKAVALYETNPPKEESKKPVPRVLTADEQKEEFVRVKLVNQVLAENKRIEDQRTSRAPLRFHLGTTVPLLTFSTNKRGDKIWILKNADGTDMTGPGPSKLYRGRMENISRLEGCKVSIWNERERPRKKVNFLMCLSDNPYIKSETGCAFDPGNQVLKMSIEEYQFHPCQDKSVYAVKDWI